MVVCLLRRSSQSIYRAGRRLGISWTPEPGTVAGRGVEVVGAVLCVLVTGREGPGVYEGFLVGERADTAEAAAAENDVGEDALQDPFPPFF